MYKLITIKSNGQLSEDIIDDEDPYTDGLTIKRLAYAIKTPYLIIHQKTNKVVECMYLDNDLELYLDSSTPKFGVKIDIPNWIEKQRQLLSIIRLSKQLEN